MFASFLRQFVHRPQQVWIRKAMFQIHLWVGLIIGFYVVLIGISGSILVFREELTHFTRPAILRPKAAGEPKIDLPTAISSIRKAYPEKKLSFIYSSRPEDPAFVGYLLEKQGATAVSVDPSDGKILGTFNSEQSLLGWIGQLHYFLLLGRSPGLILNGIGSALLLLLTVTGIVLWWPGIKAWKRAFWVDFKKSWKRINFDSHNVVGFWTLSIVSFWAISGIYFAWPREVTAFVNFFSPVSQRPQRITVPPNKTGKWADLRSMIAHAEEKSPGRKLAAVRFPFNERAPFMLYMNPPGATDLLHADFVYFEPATGKYLSTLHRGENKTAGDWIIWAMHPLHFGTSWGLGVKVLYFVLGFSLPLLVITGTFMYWNRYLSKKWKQLKQRRPVDEPVPAAAVHAQESA